MPIRWVKQVAGLPAAVVLAVVVAEAAPQAPAGPPDADFLEFLGSWDNGDDSPKWIDPFQLDDPVLSETDRPDELKSRGNRRDESKNSRTDDNAPSKQPSPYSVHPGGGVRP